MPPLAKKAAFVLALAAGMVLLSALVDGRLIPGVSIPPYPLRIVTLAGINIILAVSLNLINGFTGQFSIGHAGFMAIGAYGAAWLAVTFGRAIENALGFLPAAAGQAAVVLAALAFGALLAAVGGLLVGVPSLRLRGDYLAIVTLGFGEIIRVFILNIDTIGGARGYSGIPNLAGFGWVYFFAIVTVLLIRNIVGSSFGRTLLAVREDEIAAEAMGVNTTRAKVLSFLISSTLAGVAGGLFAFYNMYLHTNSFTFIKSIEFIIMIVIGGLGSILGAVVGAVVYIVMTEGLRAFEQYRMVLFSLLLVLIMIFRPQGLFGHRDFSYRYRPQPQPSRPDEGPAPPPAKE
jgi:branched-chain amino acid transport system permease protein